MSSCPCWFWISDLQCFQPEGLKSHETRLHRLKNNHGIAILACLLTLWELDGGCCFPSAALCETDLRVRFLSSQNISSARTLEQDPSTLKAPFLWYRAVTPCSSCSQAALPVALHSHSIDWVGVQTVSNRRRSLASTRFTTRNQTFTYKTKFVRGLREGVRDISYPFNQVREFLVSLRVVKMKENPTISQDHSLFECQFINILKTREKASSFAAKDLEQVFVVMVFTATHMANSHQVFVDLLIFMSRCYCKLPDVFAQTSKMFA